MFKDKKFLKEIAIIFLVGIIVNALCFFLCSITGHCVTISSEYYPFYWGENNIGVQEDIDTIIGFMSDPNSQYYGYDNCFIRVVKENQSGYDVIYYAVQYYSDYYYLVADIDSQNQFSFNVNRAHFEQGTDAYTTCTFARGFNNSQSLQLVFSSANFNGCQSSLYNHTISYYSTFSTLYDYYDNVVITSPQEDIVVGDFSDLPNIDQILNNINNTWEPPSTLTGHALPSQPTENPNNNDFQNRLQMFEYLKDSINSIVGNLGYNLKNWFDNLKSTIVNGFNSVSQNIWNGFKTLMDNIKDFFGPKIDAIIEKFNYITEPFDSQELSINLNNAAFSSDFLSLITIVSSFGSALTSATEPNSCTFTLDFSNSYYNFGVCEFSLDWILPFRSIIRLIIGCLCVYSLIISIFTSLNTFIGGTSSINDDI